MSGIPSMTTSVKHNNQSVNTDKHWCQYKTFVPVHCKTEIYLTYRFLVAVHLFSNRSQMTSKCGKNKKVAHEAIATFWCPLLLNRRMPTWNLFVLYNKETNYYSFFISESHHFSKDGWPLPTLVNRKKAIWHNLLSIQNEAISLVAMHSKELWLVQENHATVKLDLNGFLWNENLQRKQNPQILNKMLEGSFCHQSSPVSRKCGMISWMLLEFKEYAWKTSGCSQHWRPFDSSFVWKER